MAIIAPAPEELNLGQVENEEVLTLLECPVCCLPISIFCLHTNISAVCLHLLYLFIGMS